MGEEAESLTDGPDETAEAAGSESETVTDGAEQAVEVQGEVEVEVVRQGGTGSLPDKQHGIRKRINRLNAKVTVAETSQAEIQRELDHEREKSRLLQFAVDQKSAEPLVPPDPGEFIDGVRDPQYAEALRKFNEPAIRAEVEKHTANLATTQAAPASPDLERNQRKHYERVAELGAKDYDEVEAEAIAALGKDTAMQLIQNSKASHLVLYYLGKHPEEAEAMKILLETHPVEGVLQLGQLAGELSVSPRAKSEPAPDPDEELRGGTPSAGQANAFQKRVDQARKAQRENGGTMDAILAIKKEAKEAGATVT